MKPKDIFKNSLARRGFFSRFTVSESDKHIEPELLLGRAILDKALVDSFHSEEASAWFDAQGSAFCTICFIAGVDADGAAEKFLKVKTLTRSDSMDKKTFDLLNDLMVE